MTSRKSPYTLYEKVKIQHVEEACDWAQDQIDSFEYSDATKTKIDGTKRIFDMGNWDCKTSCCLGGGAALIAGYDQKLHRKGSEMREEWPETTIAGVAGYCMCSHLTINGKTSAERELADIFRASFPDYESPSLALKACAKIRKERGLPPRREKATKKKVKK